MKTSSVSVGVVSALVALVALAAACGGAASTDVEPGADTDGGNGGSSGTSGASGTSGTSGSSGASGTSGTSGSSGDAGDAGNAGDATVDAATTSAFTGAPAYTPTTGRNTLKPGEHPGNGNPTKLACLGCHGPGGSGPRFFAAGSVFKDVGGTMPAAQVEVRLRTDAGKTVSTYTDVLGNFVVTANAASNAGVAFPLHVGARNASAVQLMTSAPANGDCNSSTCHGGTQGWIHVP